MEGQGEIIQAEERKEENKDNVDPNQDRIDEMHRINREMFQRMQQA